MADEWLILYTYPVISRRYRYLGGRFLFPLTQPSPFGEGSQLERGVHRLIPKGKGAGTYADIYAQGRKVRYLCRYLFSREKGGYLYSAAA